VGFREVNLLDKINSLIYTFEGNGIKSKRRVPIELHCTSGQFYVKKDHCFEFSPVGLLSKPSNMRKVKK